MPNGRVLELSSLPARHPPIGHALLQAYAPAAIVRLRIDPTPQPPDTMVRSVDVDWITRPGTNPAVSERRDIGWNGLEGFLAAACIQLPITVNAHTLTEQAAIAVMALLISDLEGGVVQSVFQIGSGADYLILPRRSSNPIQVEVSGIRYDASGNASRARLAQKSAQVLTNSEVGYASVTTFSHSASVIVHSYLHYVRRQRKGKGGRKGGKK